MPRTVSAYQAAATNDMARIAVSRRGTWVRVRPSPVRPLGVTRNVAPWSLNSVAVASRFGVMRTNSKSSVRTGRWQPRESAQRASCESPNVAPNAIAKVRASAVMGTAPVATTIIGRSR